MNKKGFTILEIVLAICIFSLASSIAVISYFKFTDKIKEDYYRVLESNLTLSAESYFNENRGELPINDYKFVPIGDLVDNNYIEEVKDTNGDVCSGYVYIYSNANNPYEYETCLKCADYASEGMYCNKNYE